LLPVSRFVMRAATRGLQFRLQSLISTIDWVRGNLAR
jgi:hypothetical protein